MFPLPMCPIDPGLLACLARRSCAPCLRHKIRRSDHILRRSRRRIHHGRRQNRRRGRPQIHRRRVRRHPHHVRRRRPHHRRHERMQTVPLPGTRQPVARPPIACVEIASKNPPYQGVSAHRSCPLICTRKLDLWRENYEFVTAAGGSQAPLGVRGAGGTVEPANVHQLRIFSSAGITTDEAALRVRPHQESKDARRTA